MGSFGGYYKGEKKKKKKGEGKAGSFGSLGQPVFTLPKLIAKKKKEY